ncbi:MAG: hypothetical protein KA160_01975 [Lacibacter sp.]|nr:hypothetical protein [Lacibacter sp.]
MNEFSLSVYQSLLSAFPDWESIQITVSELLELEIPSPNKSLIGGLIIQTTDDNSIWIRNNQPCTAYPVDTMEEMKDMIRNILSDQIFWVIGYKADEWHDTTLLNNLTNLLPEEGVKYQILSWSGHLDQIISI